MQVLRCCSCMLYECYIQNQNTNWVTCLQCWMCTACVMVYRLGDATGELVRRHHLDPSCNQGRPQPRTWIHSMQDSNLNSRRCPQIVLLCLSLLLVWHAGFVKLLVKPKCGTILGATIVGGEAGNMISEVTVAMQAGMKLGALAAVIHPYPTKVTHSYAQNRKSWSYLKTDTPVPDLQSQHTHFALTQFSASAK